MSSTRRALIVIDVQNDYFAEGKFPLWNSDATLTRIEAAIARARANDVAVILVQHLAEGGAAAAMFAAGSPGVQLHPRLLAAAPDAPVVTKTHADGFFGTTLEATLQRLGVDELLVCGMMTQNCVTHTAISRSAEKYAVTILRDCCTTVSAAIHNFALRAVETRLTVADAERVL